jgi:hypothetical protein
VSVLLAYSVLCGQGLLISVIILGGFDWKMWFVDWDRATGAFAIMNAIRTPVGYYCHWCSWLLAILGVVWIWFRPLSFRWIASAIFAAESLPTFAQIAYLTVSRMRAGRWPGLYEWAFDCSSSLARLLVPLAVMLFALRYLSPPTENSTDNTPGSQ